MKTKTRWLVAPALLLALTAACGGDDDDDDAERDEDTETETTQDDSAGSSAEAEYVAALAADLDESGAFGDAATNECMARAMVHAFGVQKLQEADVSPDALVDADTLEELPVDFDGDLLWEEGNGCTDLGLRIVTSAAQGDEGVAQCVMDATTEQERKALFVSSLEGEENIDAAAATAIGAALQVCAPTTTTTG